MVSIEAGLSLALVAQIACVYLINYQYCLYISIGIFCGFSLIYSQLFLEPAISGGLSIIGSFLVMRAVGMFLAYPYEFTYFYLHHVFFLYDSVRILTKYNLLNYSLYQILTYIFTSVASY